MSDWEANTETKVAISPSTLTKLEAVAVVREMNVQDVLDEAVEAARAKLSPRPKAPSAPRPRRPKDHQQ